jgi:hypothetical protein
MGLGAVLSESVYKYCYVLRILRAILCCFLLILFGNDYGGNRPEN